MSLAELLVTIGLLSIVGTLVLSTFVRGLATSRNSDARSADGAAARIALEDMTKQLRAAVDPDGDGPLLAFETATPTDVTFYAAVGNRSSEPAADGPPQRVRFWLDTAERAVKSQVVKGVLGSGGATTWPGAGVTRVLARGAAVPQPRPVFTYLGAVDQTLNADNTTRSSLLASGGALTAEGRSSVDAVEIWLTLQTDTGGRRVPTTAVSRVTLLN